MFYLQLFADPKSAKRQLSHQCLFTLLGSAQVKVARKALVKLTPSAGTRAFFVNNGIWETALFWGTKDFLTEKKLFSFYQQKDIPEYASVYYGQLIDFN